MAHEFGDNGGSSPPSGLVIGPGLLHPKAPTANDGSTSQRQQMVKGS
jgi:hypothetical protein